MPYHPDAAFADLFRDFTGGAPESIGSQLTRVMVTQSADDPLLVSTASDIALFPGGGAPARIESFRKSTRGFIELTAVSHLPLALCYIARMRSLQPAFDWQPLAKKLMADAQLVRAANTETMWREHVALRAFSGLERKIVDMVEYTLAVSIDYIDRAFDNPAMLDFEPLRRDYLDADPAALPVSMNDIMFATFCLAYIDIAYRIGNWLREQQIAWPRAMVLVSGQSGRPTAGASWSSNNICNLIWQAAGGGLPAERLYVAPFAPGLSVAQLPDAAGLAALEQTYRHTWCHTRASVEVSREAFAGYEAFTFSPAASRDMPALNRVTDHAACVARLRRIMEDPSQLLSNCVADYVVDSLRDNGNRPEAVDVPGFTLIDFAQCLAHIRERLAEARYCHVTGGSS